MRPRYIYTTISPMLRVGISSSVATFYYDNPNWLAGIRELHCMRRGFSKSPIRNARPKFALAVGRSEHQCSCADTGE
jgi:hypothetical protein